MTGGNRMQANADAIRDEIRNRIQPVIRSHRGDVEYLGCENGVVSVRLTGACAGCPSADITTRLMIRDMLKERFPWIKDVALDDKVDEDMMAFARKLLHHQ